MNIRNATCVATEASKAPTRVGGPFVYFLFCGQDPEWRGGGCFITQDTLGPFIRLK